MIENNTEATEATEAVQSDADGVETGTVVEDTGDAVSAELVALREALAAKEAELNQFKRDVTVITGRYAEKHDLCTVVDTALSELGLRRPIETRKVEVTLTLTYEAEVQSGRRGTLVTADQVWSTVHNVAYALRRNAASEVAESYANQPATRGMTIDSEVSISEPINDSMSHLLPDGPQPRCANCDTPKRTRPSGKLRCPHGCDNDRS